MHDTTAFVPSSLSSYHSNYHSSSTKQQQQLGRQQHKQILFAADRTKEEEEEEEENSLLLSSSSSQQRRSLLLQKLPSTLLGITTSLVAFPNIPAAFAKEVDPRRITKVVLQTPREKLGLQLGTTTIGSSRSVVIIQGVRNPINSYKLQEGMVLLKYTSAKDVFDRIQNGPYPIELEFLNLAAGGDAFDDLGETIVTPRDALELNQRLAKEAESVPISGTTRSPYTITTISKPSTKPCLVQSRRGDLLEILYQAFYLVPLGTIASTEELTEEEKLEQNKEKVIYDSSSYRYSGGQAYKTVLGSGDMIAGVDQGLYDMCPGEARLLEIPPGPLAYGRRALDNFNIPPNYNGLQWKVLLVSINGVIKESNNDVSRDERELGRVL